MRFTNHDKLITLTVGASAGVYTPVGGAGESARRRENAFKDHDAEFRGLITTSAITEADLRGGRYQDAQVDEYLVDYSIPWLGPIFTHTYWIDEVSHNGEYWIAPTTGATRWLGHQVGEVIGRVCGATLGDSRCKVNLAGNTATGLAITVTGTITGIIDGKRRRIFQDTGLSGGFPDDHFARGKITFTSGLNINQSGEVKKFTQATRQIELQLPMRYDIAVGDTFTLIAGCNKLRTTCISKFGNIVNNRAFPFMPATDTILKAPVK